VAIHGNGLCCALLLRRPGRLNRHVDLSAGSAH